MMAKNNTDSTAMKVAVIEPVGGHGGMDSYDMGLCCGLTSAGVEPTLFTCDRTSLPGEMPFAVIHSYQQIYGAGRKSLRGLRFAAGSLAAFARARRQGNRVCHLHFFQTGPLECMNVVLAKLFGMKLVITAHDIESLGGESSIDRLARFCYGAADRIIVHNTWSRRELANCAGASLESKISIIPHGNYIGQFQELPPRDAARARLGLPKENKVLLFFGQIKQVKGLDLLLQALPPVKAKHPELTLLIAGKVWKDDYTVYEQIITQLKLQQTCRADLRYIPDTELVDYYAAADLVVLPYRRIYQSGALLLAMSLGIPVLASDLPGMAEVVDHGINGFLFRQGDVTSLADSLITILAHPDEASQAAQKGVSHMAEKFAWPHIGQLTAACYRDALRQTTQP